MSTNVLQLASFLILLHIQDSRVITVCPFTGQWMGFYFAFSTVSVRCLVKKTKESCEGLVPPVVFVLDQPSLAPRGRVVEAVEVAQWPADGAGVLGQTLDVLKGHVDDADGAGLAVQMTAGEASEMGSVGDAALAVRVPKVQARRETAGQRAALHTRCLARAQLHGWPENGKVLFLSLLL